MSHKTPDKQGNLIEWERPRMSGLNTRRGLTLNQGLVDRRATVNGTRICSIQDCDRAQKSRGMCDKHYRRLKRWGPSLQGPPRKSAEERIMARVTRLDGGCWDWNGKIQHGYGSLVFNNVTWRAHRFSYSTFVGEIPDGLYVDHICHRKSCVNPEHLRIANDKQNCENRNGAASNSASGVRNVFMDPRNGRWVVVITHDGTHYRFGSYETLEEADRVATQKRLEMFTHSDPEIRGIPSLAEIKAAAWEEGRKAGQSAVVATNPYLEEASMEGMV